ncbi:hypothetical protein B0H66DRAFT_551774 [Apodospora peruviana]|uniref:Uncharacterized protein n=1 Tax=Apodospora peruviana TaxID=516989 RepID=A0AAE0IKQ3_9PEZI|nr:hypothetical protein B0H66DRAFT_551774 [Apodospora peruviana]
MRRQIKNFSSISYVHKTRTNFSPHLSTPHPNKAIKIPLTPLKELTMEMNYPPLFESDELENANPPPNPLWLAAATGITDPESLPPITIIDLTSSDSLETQLSTADKHAKNLHLTGDAPTAEQWSALGAHFASVQNLHVQTGYREHWNDVNFPLNWPLELLVISDACGEVVWTPAVAEGRVPHVVFYLTSGLRFDDGWDAEDKEGDEWLVNKKSGKPFWRSSSGGVQSATKKLEIIENDAIETLVRLAVAHPHVVMGLESLTLRTLDGCDMMALPDDILTKMLPHLTNLKSLKLSVAHYILFPSRRDGEAVDEEEIIDLEAEEARWHEAEAPLSIHQALPPNLEELEFQGPVSLTPFLGEWVSAFKRADFLPKLRKVAFVLDHPGGEGGGFVLGDEEEDDDDGDVVPEKDLAAAKAAVKKLLDVLAARGVEVRDEISDPWFDEQWEELEEDEEEEEEEEEENGSDVEMSG